MAALDWDHRCHEIPSKGIERNLQLDGDTRAALAEDLRVLGFDHVTVSYDIVPLQTDRFRFRGRVAAEVRLECGVSLDPIMQHIDEPFDVEYRPATDGQGDGDLGFDPLVDVDVERIVNGRMDAGRVITEVIASAIDPFARAEGVALDQSEATPVPDPASHPFAALASLKSTKTEADPD